MKSKITEYDNICAICGRPAECTHHCVFGNGLRKLAEIDSLTIPLCNRCHNMGMLSEKIHGNSCAEALSKMVGQLAWEKDYYRQKASKTDTDEAREEFRKIYHISFL